MPTCNVNFNILSVTISPRFIMANANSNSSPSRDGEDRKNYLSLSDGKPRHRRLSWRQEIFNRVVTPSRQPNTPTVPGRQSVIIAQKMNDFSRHIRKPTICIGKNKVADQLCSNCTADQHLCFCYTDSTIPLLLKSEISIF